MNELLDADATPRARALLLTRERQDQERIIESCRAIGIPAQAHRTLLEAHPLLHPSPYRFAVAVPDRHVDTTSVIRRLAQLAAGRGCAFVPVPTLDALTFERAPPVWKVRAHDVEVRAHVIVLATGPYVPHLLRRVPEATTTRSMTVARTRVLVVQVPITPSALIAPFDPAPHIVPFGLSPAASTIGGATVCIARDEEVCSLPDRIAPPTLDRLRTALQVLADYHPGIVTLARSLGRIPLHAYYCFKLLDRNAPVSDGMIPDLTTIWEQVAAGAYILYARKFSSAPAAAERWAEDLVSTSNLPHSRRRWSAPLTRLPPVAAQPYRLSTTHWIESTPRSLTVSAAC
jgi:hypothetical protein